MKMKQLALDIAPPPEAGFDSLLIGANAQAVAHLRELMSKCGSATLLIPPRGADDVPVGLGALSRELSLPAAPVYLWGPSGSGKTRLLRALAAQRLAQGERVAWFDNELARPWAFDSGCSLVIVDDCHALDAHGQAAAFTLFVEAGSHGQQWAAAGRLPPVDLPLRDDLRTRLGWGQVFALQPLPEADTRAALRREADRRGIFLCDEVMDYLLTRFQRDLKHLMRLLDRLDALALAEQRHVTVPLLRKMVAEQGSVQ